MNRQFKYKTIAIAAMALLASSCSRDDSPSPYEPGPKGTPVATLGVSIGEPSPGTRVGVTVDDNGKQDIYDWIAGDIIHLLELNADGTAFTGKRYEYTFVHGSNGKFSGSGVYLGRKFVPVHIRTTQLMTWPRAGATAFDYAMPNITQSGPWTDADVKQAYVDNLLFVGDAVKLESSKTPITLLHTLTQVQLDIKAVDARLNDTQITTVRLEADGNHFASKLRFGVNGALNEAGSAWGKSSSTTTVTDANAKLNNANAYHVRVLTRQKSSISSTGMAFINNSMISTPSTANTLAVGKVYKATHAVKPAQIHVNGDFLAFASPRSGTRQVTIVSDLPWSVKNDLPRWITVNPSSGGPGTSYADINFGQNISAGEEAETRSHVVTFTDGYSSGSHTLRQKEANYAVFIGGNIWKTHYTNHCPNNAHNTVGQEPFKGAKYVRMDYARNHCPSGWRQASRSDFDALLRVPNQAEDVHHVFSENGNQLRLSPPGGGSAPKNIVILVHQDQYIQRAYGGFSFIIVNPSGPERYWELPVRCVYN